MGKKNVTNLSAESHWYEFYRENHSKDNQWVSLSLAGHTRRRKFDAWLQKRGLCLSKENGSYVLWARDEKLYTFYLLTRAK